jgi:hypothetical protein
MQHPDDGFFDQTTKFLGGMDHDDWTQERTSSPLKNSLANRVLPIGGTGRREVPAAVRTPTCGKLGVAVWVCSDVAHFVAFLKIFVIDM